MATYVNTGTEETPRTEVVLEPGESVWLCRCMKSKKFPYCDGAHKQYDGFGPVKVECPAAESRS